MAIVAEVVEHGCQLQHTLQTWQGMVVAGGRAKQRDDAMHDSFFKEREAGVLADAAHLLKRLPYSYGEVDALKRHPRRQRVFLQNLWSCTGGQAGVTERTLLEYIKNKKRLDVEQAVAMVLAFVPNEVGEALAPLVSDMFVDANMWREKGDFEMDENTLNAARVRKMTRLRDTVVAMAETGGASGDERSLVDALMRVRRKRSAFMSGTQRLKFPKYLLALVPSSERDAWTESYKNGLQTTVIEEDRVVTVSKRGFARMQRWLLRLDGDQSAKSAYIREVAELEKEVLFGNLRIDALKKTTDRAALAYSFMAVQRRLQLTVVSDLGWTAFLQKGQARAVLQNRPDIVTSFEDELARHASDVQALVAIRPPKAHEAIRPADRSDELIPQVDRVCTLMEQYVLLFGDGLFENLRFSRDREKGRGPESVYNQLVDLLKTLRERGKGCVTVGPCHKFLAKDIMAWNNAWGDDAFAPGKVPGWVQWLEARQKLQIRLPQSTLQERKIPPFHIAKD